MMTETILIMDAGLNDGTFGLAVQLADVPLESGDSAPATPTILNAAEDDTAARDVFPEGVGPFLMIGTQILSQGEPMIRPVQDMQVPVVLKYLIRGKNTAAMERTASATFRATLRVLSKLVSPVGDAIRDRNETGMLYIDTMSGGAIEAPDPSTEVSWGITVTCRMRDNWANT